MNSIYCFGEIILNVGFIKRWSLVDCRLFLTAVNLNPKHCRCGVLHECNMWGKPNKVSNLTNY